MNFNRTHIKPSLNSVRIDFFLLLDLVMFLSTELDVLCPCLNHGRRKGLRAATPTDPNAYVLRLNKKGKVSHFLGWNENIYLILTSIWS